MIARYSRPERVREEHAVDDVEARARPRADRDADEVAEAVDRADRRVVERAHEERAGQMRRMMLDVPHLVATAAGSRARALATTSAIPALLRRGRAILSPSSALAGRCRKAKSAFRSRWTRRPRATANTSTSDGEAPASRQAFGNGAGRKSRDVLAAGRIALPRRPRRARRRAGSRRRRRRDTR